MNLLKVLRNVRKKPVAPISTECNSEGQDNPAHGAVYGARTREDCDGAHHHLGEPEGQDADSSTQTGCTICMGTRVCEMEPFRTLNYWISYGLLYPSYKNFAKQCGCVRYKPREPSVAIGAEPDVRLPNHRRELEVQGLVNETIQSAEEAFKKFQEKNYPNGYPDPAELARLVVASRNTRLRPKTGDEPNQV